MYYVVQVGTTARARPALREGATPNGHSYQTTKYLGSCACYIHGTTPAKAERPARFTPETHSAPSILATHEPSNSSRNSASRVCPFTVISWRDKKAIGGRNPVFRPYEKDLHHQCLLCSSPSHNAMTASPASSQPPKKRDQNHQQFVSPFPRVPCLSQIPKRGTRV